ncbi:MAG: gamma-glutamyltransferase [Gemmatimonadales bacterium]|nr:gamma-glutamyltransferase [Gemmatimonadales bacterium]
MRRHAWLALWGTLLAAKVAAQAPAQGIAPDWPLLGRAKVTEAGKAMVVSAHPVASEIGRDVLLRGGNAIDAAVATFFALAVVHPEAGNLGGGGFMMYRRAPGYLHALDFREVAPGAATPTMYVADPATSHTGHLASGVPGSVAGMVEAHRRFGRLPWRSLLQPAIRLAREGFVIDDFRSTSIRNDSTRLSKFPASAAQFLPNGAPPPVGSTLAQPDLARTLEAIRDRRAAGFYRGWVADSLVAEMERGGGIITRADLRAYRTVWRMPLRLTYRGYTLYSMPPVSSGGVTLGMILNVMEGYKPLPPFGSPALLHREAEAFRRAYIERNAKLGDPAFVKNPVTTLTNKRFAAWLRSTIDTARATLTPDAVKILSEGPSTTHFSVVDAAGNAVSLTTTINSLYGNAVTVRGAGFLLNDEMDDFMTVPGGANQWGSVDGQVNAIAPGKRMLSSMTPTIVLDARRRVHLLVGSPGGTTIITTVYHILSNLIDHGMTLADAIAAPRMFHQARPDSIQFERDKELPAGVPEATVAELQRLGHGIRYRPLIGDVAAIIRTATGWQAVSDPRRSGGGAGH